jgi:hypothetical protein
MPADPARAIALRLILASLDEDHDMRIRTLHETDDTDELRTIVNILTHVAAKSWLDICGGDRAEAIKLIEARLMRQLDSGDPP